MRGFRKIVHEAHRRSLWQVLGLYLAGSWVALQVVGQIADSLALPPWVEPFAVILLVLGFPVVLATAFVQEGLGSSTGSSAAAAVSPASTPDTVAGAHGEPIASAPTRAPRVGSGPPDPRPATPASRRLFTWRNTLLGGGAAFLLLAVVTWGFMTMRSRGIGPVGSLVAKGVLDARAPILLADVDGAGLELAGAATEALRVDLSQSDIVRLVEPARVAEALARMERPAGSRLDEELARELAVREGIPAVVAGDLAAVGRGFSLTARILSPADGAVLASARSSAKDSTQVLEAIDDLSRQLRERVGESYGSLRSDPPLAKVTTASLEALRKYSESLRLTREGGDEDAGIELLEEAVRIDSTFASAWRSLAIALGNRFQEPSRQIDALERAYRLRDRLTERERLAVEAAYARAVLGDDDRTIRAYEALLRLEPENAGATNNIGVVHYWRGEHEKALEFYRRADALDSLSALTVANVAVTLGNLGARAAADSAYAEMRLRPGARRFRFWAAMLPSAFGDYGEADARLAAALEAGPAGPQEREDLEAGRAVVREVRGRFSEARPHRREAMEAARRVSPDHLLGGAAEWAQNDLVAFRDTARALRTVEEALDAVPLEEIPAADWPAAPLARVLAGAGRPDEAEALLDGQLARTDPRLRPLLERRQQAARGAVTLARGDAAAALEAFRRQPPGDCRPCAALGPALAFDAMGRADSAIAHFEEYIGHPFHWRAFPDAAWRAHVLERLGALYDAHGDLEQAAGWYAQFVDLWADADPELQPRVRAARARLEEILAERG